MSGRYFCGVVGGGRFSGFGAFLERLLEEVYSGAVLPLQALHTDIMCPPTGPLDAPVCGLHQSDGNPTLEISARTRVGLIPFFCKVAD